MSIADWDNVNNTNLKGTFIAIKAVLSTMKALRYSRIVLISFITGPRTCIPGLAHYAASKGGMNDFMKAAALELAEYSISINAVEPGNTLTEGLENAGQDYMNTMIETVPMGSA